MSLFMMSIKRMIDAGVSLTTPILLPGQDDASGDGIQGVSLTTPILHNLNPAGLNLILNSRNVVNHMGPYVKKTLLHQSPFMSIKCPFIQWE